MILTLIQLLPIFFLFSLGVFLKKVRFASTDNAGFLLKLVFFISLPSLVVLQLSQTALTPEKLTLPLINIIVNLSCMAVSLILFRMIRLKREMKGTMLVCTMIVNNVFMFPFIMAGFGAEGFVDAVIFDFGNGLTTATITYITAFRFSGRQGQSGSILMKLILSPLFWSFPIALTINIFSISIPVFLAGILEPLSRMTSPLILIALGIFFHPRLADMKWVSVTIFIRMGIGLLTGAVTAAAMGLGGQTLKIVMLCSGAPVGFMALTFASIARLDQDFASRTVSISILIGLIYVPVFLILAQ